MPFSDKEAEKYLSVRSPALDAFDPGTYRLLVKNIGGLKDSLSAERESVEQRILKLESDRKESAVQHRKIQGQLGKQVAATNRGYSFLLQQFQELQRQHNALQVEMDQKLKSAEEAKAAVDLELHVLKKDSEEAIRVRDENIRKAGEPVIRLQAEVFARERVIEEIKVAHREEVEMFDRKVADAYATCAVADHQIMLEKKKFADRQIEMKESLDEVEKVKGLAKYAQQKAELRADGLAEELAESQQKVADLLEQIAKDDTADVVRAECEEEFQKLLKVKERGYQKLVDDFTAMHERSLEQMQELRASYDTQIHRLEAQLGAATADCKRIQDDLTAKLTAKAKECDSLLRKMVELRALTDKERARYAEGGEGLELKIKALEDALKEYEVENDRLREDINTMLDTEDGTKKSLDAKVKMLELNMRRLQAAFEAGIAAKEEEVRQAMSGISRMQEEIDAERKRSEEREKSWLEKVEAKEEAYDRLVGENAVLVLKLKRAEEYAEEIWAKVRAKEREMLVQAMEYEHKLDTKRHEIVALKQVIDQLETDVVDAKRVTEEQRGYYERVLEQLRRENKEIENELRLEVSTLKQEVKSKQKEIFDLMREMERLKAEWAAEKAELLATIKDRERTIDQLRAEMKFRIQQLQQEIDELTKSYDLLKRKYELDLTGDNSVQSLKQSMDRLQRQLLAQQQRLEDLQAQLRKLREKLRLKEFELEDVKRECADICLQKEKAYKALLDDVNKMRDELDSEKKKFREQAYKMGREFKRQRVVFEEKIVELEDALEREKEQNTIILELRGVIDVWKKKLQVALDAHKADVQELKETLAFKDKAIARLLEDIDEYHLVTQAAKQKVKDLEAQHPLDLEKQLRQFQVKEAEYERLAAEARKDFEKLLYQLNDPEKVKEQKRKIAAEKERQVKLKEKLEIQALEIEASRIAVAEMAEENTAVRKLLAGKREHVEGDKMVLEKQINSANKRFKRMLAENEDLRRVLNSEMDKAERTLQAMEVQFLEMPNPFADEVRDLRERLRDSQAQMDVVGKENMDLAKELSATKRFGAESQFELERKLEFTMEMLRQMKAAGNLQLLAQADFMEAFEADDDGVLTWDEALPILMAKGLTEQEAREAFDRLDLSGDGQITRDEFEVFRQQVLTAGS